MRYLTDAPRPDEAGYTVEEGIVVDSGSEPTRYSRAANEASRDYRPSRLDLEAEEIAWAARSGPVIIIRPAQKA